MLPFGRAQHRERPGLEVKKLWIKRCDGLSGTRRALTLWAFYLPSSWLAFWFSLPCGFRTFITQQASVRIGIARSCLKVTQFVLRSRFGERSSAHASRNDRLVKLGSGRVGTGCPLSTQARRRTTPSALHVRTLLDSDRAVVDLIPLSSEIARARFVVLARGMHRFPQISSPLHVEPEIRAVAEHAGENERGRRGDVAAIVAQLVDVLALHAHRLSQCALRQPDRLHEFLDQDFARCRRLAFRHQHGLPHT